MEESQLTFLFSLPHIFFYMCIEVHNKIQLDMRETKLKNEYIIIFHYM